MSTINTNLTAMNAAITLDRNQDLLSNSIDALSSGSTLTSAGANPAGLAITDTLTSDNLRLSAASTNVQNALSYTQVSSGFLSSINSVLTRLSELATETEDPTKNSSDDAQYELEFQSLQQQLRNTIGGSSTDIGGTTVTDPEGSFNGTALFGSTTAGGTTISIGDDPTQQLTIPDINLQTGALQSLIQQDSSGNFTLSATDSNAISQITGAIQQVGDGEAVLGAAESRLSLTASSLTTQQQNISSAISGISDVDVAQESTQLAKYQILVQSSAQMLAQANQDPQDVLKLIDSE